MLTALFINLFVGQDELIWYIVARESSPADADASIKQLRDLGIEFVDADWDLAKDAGYLKSKNKMSFPDCFAAALAKQGKVHPGKVQAPVVWSRVLTILLRMKAASNEPVVTFIP